MKPIFSIPSMAEINALEWNGLNAISTFSGCGGSSLGYRMAGYRVLYANEFIDAARDTYSANKRDYTYLDGRDIRTVTSDSILEIIGLKRGDLDLLDGSPPCASFSTAGKREKAWGKVKKYSDKAQRVDDLFFEFSRLLEGLQPKVFVAENVSGLIKGTAKGYFLEILATLKKAGYNVEAKLLDAQWLGVPQARQRLIFIGTRADLPIRPAFPKPLPYRYTLRDALPWIHSVHQIEVYDEGERITTDSPVPTITQSGIGAKRLEKHYVEAESDISRYCTGREWDKLKQGQQSSKYFNLVRADLDQPSPTICASHGSPGIASVTHPLEKRKFSIEELKRICGFPDDFILTGTYKQQWERLGRAVPPVMMSHIASTLKNDVLSKI